MGASGLLLSLQNTSSVKDGGDVRLEMEHVKQDNYDDKRFQVSGMEDLPYLHRELRAHSDVRGHDADFPHYHRQRKAHQVHVEGLRRRATRRSSSAH